jgi:ATP-dependent Clp protease adaptor protein ClpS
MYHGWIMDDQTSTLGDGAAEAGVTTLPRPAASKPRPQQPRLWNVILLDDDDHSYEYVIRMLTELFGKSPEAAYQMAKEVDASGRVICMTTHRELAELKQEQVHGYGKDRLIASCQGAMTSVIEPVM